ncbi:epiplakin [Eublepharis macularius]|uniref:Epiplakin n=1 Tax=Eublepharis macularius TaxID=481883 RepID=A0AA97L3Z9_EUBMA|nr:epiplakin [Eublepharis macularius]
MEPRQSAAAVGQPAPTALPLETPAAAKAGAGTRSIAGVYVEASSKTTSLFEAVQEHLLQPDLALALLEAQAATGGIVDYGRKQLVSVAEALRMELIGLEMKEKLLSAERARTGFEDPYTEEKISLFQAIQKELIGKEQGLKLLGAQVATGGIIEPSSGHRVSLQEACERGYLSEELKSSLCDPGNVAARGFLDPNSNEKVTYMELMRRCIADPATGWFVLPLKISFPGLRGAVCSHELLDSGIIDPALFKALHNAEITAEEVAEMDSVQQYLSGTGSVAGVAVLETNECRGLYQALREHLLLPGTAVVLLQAQAATGSLIDPVSNEKFLADAAVQAGVVGPELHEKLSAAERAVTGYKDPYTGGSVSLFQAIQKGLVPRDPGIFLLDAQLATGGIIDPHTHHRLPVEVACQRGLLDRDTHALLCNPTDGIRGFFEPNSKEALSYAELLFRCVTDPDTGLFLLPLSGDPSGAHSFIDHSTRLALKNTDVPGVGGKFKGKQASLWKLLFSDYFTGQQRRSLIQQFRSGGLSIQQLAGTVRDTIQQVAANSEVTFEGLREKVTPAQLLSSKIINQDLFEKLTQGETLAKDVVNMGTVKKYLEGTSSISGLLLPDSEERISIYQARRKGFLRPGTSLILLEAQAATGYVIDPAANKKYSVDEALRANLIGPDVYDKLLVAEKAVTGYRDPYTGNKISLFQAMMEDLIVKEHGIRLLEAQIATGGIIDPVNSHRLPVEVAYKRGYFDKKMNLILSDPSDDTKGFFDPNTHENLTYLQLKEKCLTDSSTGLCLLPLNSKKRQFIDNPSKQAFRSSWLFVKYGRFQGQRVSIWDLLNSEYFSEGRRREIFNHYRLHMVTLEQIRLMLEEEMKKWARIKFPAMRGHVTAYHLVESGILDRDLFERLLEGAVSPEEVLRMDSVRKYLYGTGSIGGIVLQPSNEKVGLYEAMKRNIVLPGVVLPLLEAQAATGFIVDPVKSQKLCLDEAVRGGLVGPELYDKLQRAEEAVTGYKDPFTGKKISLFQAMKKGLVDEKQAVRLLDAQLSTGGVIDPHRGHYVPVEFAQKKGYLDENLSNILANSGDDIKTFSTLDSQENVTYSQLIGRCQEDKGSGFRLLPLSQTASLVYTDEQIERLFRDTLVKEKGLTLWELLNSGYFTEEQRRDFSEKFRSEAISLQQLISLVLGLIKETEMKVQTQVTFRGLRGAVPAVWLLDNGIISEKTFTELVQGTKTAEEVSEMEGVKKYLQGTGSIAGVYVQASKEKMGIYQAMQKNFLLPSMGARLLEAQAATGSIMDLGSNQRLGVEEAIKAGVVGKELTEQLLQAERALTGYRDPYSGRTISVGQAIKKELVPAAAGIPLLEAQLATGGVIDPTHHHHLPLHAAYKHGFYDEEMHTAVSQPSEDSHVFCDPNTQESLTYQQLKDRCRQDPETGQFLLPLSEDAAVYGDKQIIEVLKSETICINTGRFKGQAVSIWDLLNSEYISKSKRRELLMAYKKENAEALREIVTIITTIIGDTEAQGKRFTFKGLRKQVSASDLFQAELISKETLDELHQGTKTVQEVTEMDSVRQFLEGCNFIAGVLTQPTHEKMSIYQAMSRGLLRPGTALVLLEAQAATGFLIDPVKNKKLSVDEGMSTGLIGREIYEKLLSAERAVTGYTDPYTRKQISLFEAMNQELIVRSHGIRLLEAQIATGGIIDPVHSHRIPVEVAYKRGYFDEQMNQVLSDPTDDTKGFFDPNTHENLTYLQLLERCIQDPKTGLYMLQIVKRGERYFYIDETTKQFLQAQLIQMHIGRYRGQTVSIWDLLCSPYIHEQRKKDLVRQYKCEMLTLENLISIITTIIEETEQTAQKLKFKGLRGEVSAADLFNSEIIDKKTLDRLHHGAHALHQLIQNESVRRYLEGTGCIAGISVPSKKEKMTLYEAMKTGLLSSEHALVLLEAQAATGFITDPRKKKRFSVDQAVSAGTVGNEIREQLLFAEKAVTGYTDPATGNKLPLFQAMKKNIVEKAQALRLLEAQIATGGIIDPECGHRIPVEVAYKRGCLDDDTLLLLSDPEYGFKGFVDPNTHERITYAQLLQRCIKDKGTGMYHLQMLNKSKYFYVDEAIKNTLSSSKVNIKIGKYAGQTLSLWELLCSDYIDEEKRKELLKKYKQDSSVILQHITNEILSIIETKERNRTDIWFQGLRQHVTASELFKADIISKDTMKKLEEGRKTVEEVANMDLVKRYLEGTSCIAGVLVPPKSDPSKTHKMTIYGAMWKGILRPGTALVLLEAQAATGFIIDPLKNEKLSVDDAISAGLVGAELQEKLLSAERAVTGYNDPYTGNKISLFQAMNKGLIVKDHGIRLLEAQIATGGIIDPVHSHRLPVEVAYKRGYFDEEMNQILSDPTDDTKGFFDPNTHENLTYMQLLLRCVPDPDTGLLMLPLMEKGSLFFALSENTRKSLQSAKTTVDMGIFQGQEVSVWDLLFSKYIPPHKRQELLRQYKVGTITLQEITKILITIVTEIEERNTRHTESPQRAPSPPKRESLKHDSSHPHPEEAWQKTLKTTTTTMPAGEHHGQRVFVWDLLFSDYISEEKRTELLELYRRGLLPVDKLINVLTTLVTKKEATSRKLDIKVKNPDQEMEAREEACGISPSEPETWETSLRSHHIQVSPGGLQGQQLSLWDALFSQYVPEGQGEELLSSFQNGTLTLEKLTEILTSLFAETTTRESTHPRAPETPARSMGSLEEEEERDADTAEGGEMEKALKARKVEITAGEFRGRKVSVWDLLHSKYIPAEKRKELLHLYRTGILTIDQMETVVTGIINRTEEEKTEEAASHSHSPSSWEESLRNHTVELHVGEFQGQEASLWDLLFSQYISESQREELLTMYQSGILSIQDMIATVASTLAGRKGSHVQDATSTLSRETALSQADRSIPAPQDGELEQALRMMTIDVPVGEFGGSKRSVWELLFSKYVTLQKRQELLEMYRSAVVTSEELIRIITTLIEETEEKSNTLKFPGLRRQVTASELFSSEIIDQDTLSDLTRGTKTVEEITEMDSVKRYLEGTSCIAGVLVPPKSDPSKTHKMTIYEAMWKGILRPGTALVLLEAQAATGFIIDPLKNEKLSVDDAVSAGLVGAELQEKLLSAERAVTGYNDPYTGNQISLFQAMNKGLIVKDHGIRLLEAQIATGGIIDPVHSHRLPVEVAYKRGYFDEEMNQILSDPTDDTKGFFDPNTHENLTYMQLLLRCVPDPDTGLLMLPLMEKGSLFFALSENTRKSLQSAKTTVDVGIFQGQEVSVWDLLFSRYIPPHKRQELLRQYKAGTITLQEITKILITIVTEIEERNTRHTESPQRAPSPPKQKSLKHDSSHPHPEEAWQKTLKTTTTTMPVGEHHGQRVFVWDLLFSDYISEEKRTELLELYRRGLLPVDKLINVLTTLITKKEATSRKLDIKVRSPDQEMEAREEARGISPSEPETWETSLRSHHIQVSPGGLQGQQLSLWDALFSQYVPEGQGEELLSSFQNGTLTLEKLTEVLTSLFAETTTRGSAHPRAPETPARSMGSLDEDEERDADTAEGGEMEKALKARKVEITAGEFRGRKVSVWDLLHSKYIPAEKRKELLHLYRTGILTIDQMETVVTGIINRIEEEKTEEAASHSHSPSSWEESLQNHTVELHVGEFQGQEASLWDLLFSQYISESQREELLTMYQSGILSIQDMIATVASTLAGRKGSHVHDATSTLSRETALSQADRSIPAPQDGELEQALRMMTVDMPVGEFGGSKRSVWDLLFSKYVTLQKRQELLEMYRSGAVTSEELIRIITTLIEETEEKSNTLKFLGLRRQVTASELFSSEIIDQDTLSDLTRGTKTVEEITEMDSVKRYLEGTSCIAGVLVPPKSDPSKTHKMTIYEAMWKGILRPGTALVLLEAQAATGFIIDPLKNEKLSVDDAVTAGLVGAELQEKLLSAERAVTGYNDPYTGNQISLFQAMNKGLIVKDHGIRLLEAQIATGGIIDPVHSHRLPVEVAYKRGYFDEEMNQILSDPTDDTKGFFDPNTHENLTYMQLLLRCVPDPDTGLLMLPLMEKGSLFFALSENTRKSLQSAKTTVDVGIFQGQEVSVWDLLFSRYIPPHKRQELLRQYKAGTITLQEITKILITIVTEIEERNTRHTESPQRAPSPPKRESLKHDSSHPHPEEAWQKTLKTTTTTMPAGEHHGQRVFVWDLLFSDYISEEKRTELLELYRRGLLPVDKLISVLTTLVTKKEATSRKLDIKVRSPDQEMEAREEARGISPSEPETWEMSLRSHHIQVSPGGLQGQQLSLWDALFSQYVPEGQGEELLSSFQNGTLTLEKLTEVLTSLFAETTTRESTHPRAPETPARSMGSLEEEEERDADTAEGGEMEKALKARKVEITAGEFRGRKVSVWDLLHSEYIPAEKRKELLHLYRTGILTIDQMETVVTGIINRTEEEKTEEAASHSHSPSSWEESLRNHTVELHVGEFQGQEASLWDLLFSQYISESQREELLTMYQSGILSIQDMIATVASTLAGRKGSHVHDATSTLSRETALSQADRSIPAPQDGELEQALRMMTIDVPVGEFGGSKRSVWELLFSKYVTLQKRQELLEMYRSGAVTSEELIRIITTLIEETEEKSNTLKFPGLRRQVTASELFSSEIIDQDTLSDLTRGTKTVEEITEMDSVKRYLEGTSCIAGVLVPPKSDPSKTHKMTIYEAMWKGILRPGTALVLLEAQAATGFIIDPLKNEKLSVDDAVTAGLVGAELQEKLLSAERAVTGYNDPYTGNQISLFQAMNKGLIVKDHGIRLLEAQIATGGIIDPVHSHRLPVEVAYKRGYFDEEMNQILSDPTDDTKGFFDPNTHENLTYMQLLLRCVPDPDTGLLMLPLMEKGSLFFALSENTRKSLQSAKTTVDVGIFQGQEVSVWDLLFSRYIPPHKRQELLRQYKAGTITLQEITKILITIVTEIEERNTRHTESPQRAPSPPKRESLKHDSSHPHPEEAWQKTLKTTTTTMPAGEHHGQRVFVWDLLFSDYISEEKRTELLELYRRGLLPVDKLISVLTTLVTKKEATSRKLDIKVRSPDQEMEALEEARGISPSEPETWETSLRSHHIQVSPGGLQGQQLSLWDALFSQYVPEGQGEELLSSFQNGTLTLEKLTEILTSLFAETTTRESTHPRAPETPARSMGSLEEEEERDADTAEGGEMEKALKARKVEITAGEFRGRKVSVWDLLHSEYIPAEKRKELLHLYRTGILTIDQMETVVTGIINRTEEEKTEEAASHSHSPSSWEESLRNHTVELHVGEFQGQEASLWDLLFSQYISESQREELLTMYQSGILSIQDMIATVASTLAGRKGSHVHDATSTLSRETALSQADRSIPAPQDGELEQALRMMTVDMPVGEFGGSKRSVWDLLFSKYVTLQKRQELLEMYRSGAVTSEELIRIITTLIEETEEKSNTLKFLGLRRQVTASELFSSEIIDQDTLSDLTRGTKTVEEITEMDSVKRYLEGTSCIAGVLVPPKSDPSKTHKMTIYEAMWKGILRPGTALVLLEAQAATGFIIDPLKNEKLSVDDAVSAGLVGAELQEKLLSAERAVTGYNDPYTGNKISLFQAMNKGLIVKDHGIRLLEAQIATGGIIDPVHSHRLPVEVAYKRGYFDEEMNQILSDPTDDTKGFFDPNTHENLTYMQLLLRCVPDPDTGLLMLPLMEKGSLFFALSENTRKSLQSAKTTVDVGIFQGQEVSVWDLLFSRYIPPHKRQELLRQYKAGTITLQEITKILITIVTEIEERNTRHTESPQRAPSPPKRESLKHDSSHPHPEEAWQKTLKTTTTTMPAGEHHGQRVFVWDLLFSDYISEEKRTELLELYRRGLLPVDKLISVLTTLVTKKEATSRKLDIKVRSPDQEMEAREEARGVSPSEPETWETSLRSHHIQVSPGGLQGQQLSLWDALFSQYVPEGQGEELLSSFQNGMLTLEKLTEILTSLFAETTTRGSAHPRAPETHARSMGSLEEEEERDADTAEGGEMEKALKARKVEITTGEFRGRKVSVWDLLHSKYIPAEKRKELLHLYRTGILTIDQMETVVTGIINRTEEEKTEEAFSRAQYDSVSSEGDSIQSSYYDLLQHTSRLENIDVTIREIQDQKSSVWDPFFSKFVSNIRTEEVVHRHGAPAVSIKESIRSSITTVITQTENSPVGESLRGDAPSLDTLMASPSEGQVDIENALKSRMIKGCFDELPDAQVSLWDVCHCESIPEETRKDLLELFKSGTLTIDQLEAIVTTILSKRTGEERKTGSPPVLHSDVWEGPLRNHKVLRHVGVFQGQEASAWDLLFSQHIPEYKREELLRKYRNGGLCLEELTEILASLFAETMTSGSAHPRTPETHAMASLEGEEEKDADKPEGGETEEALKARKVEITTGEFRGRKVSVWDLLHSKYVPSEKRKELLHLYRTGILTIDQMGTVVTGIVNRTEEENTKKVEWISNQNQETRSLTKSPNVCFGLSVSMENILRSESVVVPVGDFQGQMVSCWDLLFSRYILEDKRQELLTKFKEKILSLEELISTLTNIITEAERHNWDQSSRPGRDALGVSEKRDDSHAEQQQLKKSLRTTMVHVTSGEFKGQKVCVLDLLFSKYVPQDQRQELLELYRGGALPIQDMVSVISTMIEDAECKKAGVKRRIPSKGGALSWTDKGAHP